MASGIFLTPALRLGLIDRQGLGALATFCVGVLFGIKFNSATTFLRSNIVLVRSF